MQLRLRITYCPHLTPPISGIPSSYRVHIWYGKIRMAGLHTTSWRSHDDRLRRLGTIHQRNRQTDSHVTIANTALMQYVSAGKNEQNSRRSFPYWDRFWLWSLTDSGWTLFEVKSIPLVKLCERVHKEPLHSFKVHSHITATVAETACNFCFPTKAAA